MSNPSSSNPIPPTASTVAVPTQVIIQSPGRVRRFLPWLGWMAFLMCLPVIFSMLVAFGDYFGTNDGVQERFHSLSPTGVNKVAIIEISGVIADTDEGFVKKQIDRIRDDKHVKGIIVRINSPGGTVSASDYLLHHLNKLREEKEVPLVVSMGGVAASGGYYVAMAVGDQEKSIYAEPTTTTGSIGVIIPHYNVSMLMKLLQVDDDSVVSNERKQMLSMTQPPNKEHREIIQRYVDQACGRFKDMVKSGRPAFRENGAALDEIATGEIFAAPQAVANGLVDQIGFVEDAIERVIELAGLDESTTRVVRYKGRATLLQVVGFANSTTSDHRIDVSDLLIPQAYYLWTAMPGISSVQLPLR